jgi:hypothetical protein
MSKYKNLKSICTENIAGPIIPIPARVTAELTHSSESMVKQVRQGKNGKTSRAELANQIKVADELLSVAVSVAVDKVKEIIDSNNN